MDSKTAKVNELQFFEYVNKRDMESIEGWIEQFVDDDFINHSTALDAPRNKEGLKEMFRQLFQLFPDIEILIKEIVFEQDILCFRHIMRGVKPDNEIYGIAMVKYKNGKITDRWVATEPL